MTVDIHTLAGAYALDALNDLERAAFARHMTECEACAQEVAEYLETTAPAWVHRIPTDRRSAIDIARDIITTTGWSPDPA